MLMRSGPRSINPSAAKSSACFTKGLLFGERPAGDYTVLCYRSLLLRAARKHLLGTLARSDGCRAVVVRHWSWPLGRT